MLGRIFTLSKDIRFVGFINRSGKMVEGGMREGLESIDDEIHQKRWFNQVAMRAEMYAMFDSIYGKTKMAYVERDKIKQLTFYLPEVIVLVTLQPTVGGAQALQTAYAIAELLNSKA